MALLLALVLALSALGAGTGCRSQQATTLNLTGRVVDETVALTAPVLSIPAPDIEAGFETSATADEAGSSAGEGGASGKGAGARTSGWVRVASVSVGLGQSVQQGDVIAVVETASLDAALSAAKADEQLARANLKVVEERIGTLTTTASDVASKTAELNKTITDLTLQRAELQVKLSAAETAAGSLTPTSTIPPGQTDPRVLVKQLEAAIAKIDTALEKARQGIIDLATAQTDITTARSAIQYTRDAAAAVADGYAVATEIAQAEVDSAVVEAPFDGSIVAVASQGEVLAGGAPIVVLRRKEASRIETFVTDEGRLALTVGIQAGALTDSQPSRGYTGRVSAIGNEYGYVPTWFSTKVIHLTRGFRVEIELDQGQTLPAGTPVDVSISVK